MTTTGADVDVESVFVAILKRLRGDKGKYDPNDFFRLNDNIE